MEPKPIIFLLPSDVGRQLEPPLTPAGVRRLVAVGHLNPDAKTLGGTHLFSQAAVEALQRKREARAGGKHRV
jgi:hypothetical protein